MIKGQRANQRLFWMKDPMEEQLWLAPWHFLILVLNRGGQIEITLFMCMYVLHLQERCRVGDIEKMAGT